MTHEFLPGTTSPIEETTLVIEESKTFAAFDEWMDVQLDTLVAQWKHAAAPGAHCTWRNDRKRWQR